MFNFRCLAAAAAIGLTLASGPAPSQAANERRSVEPTAEAEAMLRDVILGYCPLKVQGAGLIPNRVDLAKDGWSTFRIVEATGGLRLNDPRAHGATGVLVDLSPQNTSCWVQGQTIRDGGFGDRLRAEIIAAGGTLLDDKTTEGRRVTILGLIRPDSDDVPVFQITEYGPPVPGLITVVVTTGRKGPTSS